MQRSLKAPKVIASALLVVLLVVMSILPTFAITPPQPTGTTSLYGNSQNVTEEDFTAICRMIGEMKTLGFFQFGDFVLVGRRGSTVRLAVVPSGYTLTRDSTTITVTRPAETQIQEYNFVDGGFRFYVATTNVTSYPLENVLCWWENDTLNINPDYTYGTSHADSVIATSNAWHTYYEKVYNYDENLEAEYWQGYDVGFDDGRAEGLDEGYDTGYAEGLQAGQVNAEQRYTEGYNNGRADERAIADEELREAQIAYDDLETRYNELETEYQYAYEHGYTQGRDDTYQPAYDQGYRDGLENGTVITEDLDIPSIITSLPSAAKQIINRAFDFDIFGINVAGTLTAVLVVAIVAFVVKWLLSRK